MKACSKCKQVKKLTEFYNQKDRSHGKMSYCKSCFNKSCITRWIKRKIDAINYKGGSCSDCNISIENIHYSVFEFHHLDVTKKELDWSKLRLKSLNVINKELDKCVLLCANCHRIRHANIRDFPDQSEFT